MKMTQAKRFTLEEYHKLTEIGFFHEDDRIELIRGEIIEMAAKGTAHETCISKLLRELVRLLGDAATLRCQSPILLLNSSEPEPDFAIVKNTTDEYLSAHPEPSDVLLIIEISDSTLNYDRDVKLPLYAEVGIPDYWIFNLFDNQLEAHSEPFQNSQGNFGYKIRRIVLPNGAIALPCFPDLSLDLSRVFPPK
ncbi:Uma2 family endonuclease [Aerosakkonemataceae cyanobacterium BLCC-F50]|uniref:Uma2 family endonuclease n=1 Tax=Floridaenema flaviceps BLCC-F50 TaxID=3153642 RepID=A0ABV4XV59_9CYAN